MVATALLAGGALWAAPVRAQDAIWLPTPVDGDFNTDSNWNPTTVPTGTAFFGLSGTTSLTFSALLTTVGGWTFNSGADNYDFTTGAGLLTFNGAGITINGGSATITITTITNGTGLAFRNTSTADSATITNGRIRFDDASTAGNATITNSFVDFRDTSTAGSATITNSAGL